MNYPIRHTSHRSLVAGRAGAGLGLVAVLGACAPEPIAPNADAVCDGPVTFSRAQAWEEADLPATDAQKRVSPGVAIGDLDGDGAPDIWMAYEAGSMVLVNDGAGQFTQAEALLDGAALPSAGAVALADLDDDGDLDGWLGRRSGADLLFYNEGELHFRSVETEDSAYRPWTGSFGDLDLDGDLDLVVGTFNADFDPSAIVSGSATGAGMAVHLQGADGTFRKRYDALPDEVETALNLQPTLIDADRDGDLDIYLANDFGPYVLPNRLLQNDGSGRFERAPDCGCEVSMFAMGAGTGDANGDGIADLYISNVGQPVLLMGVGDGTFYDATLASGAAIPPTESNMTSWGTAFADLTLDGCEDMVIGYGRLGGSFDVSTLTTADGSWVDGDVQNDVLLRGDCAGGFTRLDEAGFNEPSRSRAIAIGDLDRDGRPDIVTVGKDFLHTWLASGGCPALRVTLDGGPGNRQGIGARIQAFSDGAVQTRWMLPATTSSSSLAELYFSSHAPFDRIEVTWPGGRVTVAEQVPEHGDWHGILSP